MIDHIISEITLNSNNKKGNQGVNSTVICLITKNIFLKKIISDIENDKNI